MGVAADGQLCAPGPTICRLVVIASSPVFSVMLWTEGAKTIRPPLAALAIAARSDPVPASKPFVTVNVLKTARISRASSRGAMRRPRPLARSGTVSS